MVLLHETIEKKENYYHYYNKYEIAYPDKYSPLVFSHANSYKGAECSSVRLS